MKEIQITKEADPQKPRKNLPCIRWENGEQTLVLIPEVVDKEQE